MPFEKPGKEAECRVFKWRWVILLLFMIYAVAAGMQWMEYSIITNIVVKYYHIEEYMVEWTTMSHMLAYIVTFIPALWILEKAGNRNTMLIASVGVCIGALIKCFAVSPEKFYLVLIGQAVEATAQVLTFGLAASMTASWFGPNEVALAGSLALFGDQFGACAGFLLPPLLVENQDNEDDIGKDLFRLKLVVFGITATVTILVLLFFTDKPASPPSCAQILQNEVKKDQEPMKIFFKMITRRSFLYAVLAYGVHIGSFCAIGTLLNRVFLTYHPGHEKDAGVIGFLIIFCGIIGTLVGGYYLDRTHLFKKTGVFLYVCSTIAMCAYTACLAFGNILSVYITSALLGIFMLGYYSAGLQLAIEVAYPAPEGLIACVMLFAVQVTGLIFVPIYRYMFERYNAEVANCTIIGVLVFGTLITCCVPPYTRRQDAEEMAVDDKKAVESYKTLCV